MTAASSTQPASPTRIAVPAKVTHHRQCQRRQPRTATITANVTATPAAITAQQLRPLAARAPYSQRRHAPAFPDLGFVERAPDSGFGRHCQTHCCVELQAAPAEHHNSAGSVGHNTWPLRDGPVVLGSNTSLPTGKGTGSQCMTFAFSRRCPT